MKCQLAEIAVEGVSPDFLGNLPPDSDTEQRQESQQKSSTESEDPLMFDVIPEDRGES